MTTKPNLLVILSDQLRRDALGAYGDPNVATPHIDRLASAGVRFDRAYSTYPVCVPFRFSFMTGEYAHSRFVPAIEWRMSPAERTLADEFNASGYRTIYIGKWHLYGGLGYLPGASDARVRRTPIPRTYRGRWQRWLGFEVANAPFDTCYFEDDDPAPKPLGEYQTDGLFRLAMRELESQASHGQPFCCVLSVEPPHFPFAVPARYEDRWRDRPLQLAPNFLRPASRPSPARQLTEADRADALRKRRLYYAMIENLDDNVGRMMTFLRTSGLDRNTVVVFLSDHGEMGGAHAERTTLKEHPYEASTGIPLIVCDPRLAGSGGRVISEPVCTEDLYPTLLGLCGLPVPPAKPGANLAPMVRGECARLDREGVLLEFVHDLRPNTDMCPYHAVYWRAFVGRRFKYTVLGGVAEGGQPWQLFDLAHDPWEMHNLLDDPACLAEAARQHQLLREQLIATHDHYALAPAFGQDGLNVG
ncbi:MAG: sulfatase-like hydrolase/transferase [Lentisphaerae bacterium]|nr:sulfatase-like hydrolase/transferase [Lentisphaerota bacterium]